MSIRRRSYVGLATLLLAFVLDTPGASTNPIQQVTGVKIDPAQTGCQSVYLKFDPVAGANYYQLYRDKFVVRNVPVSDVGTEVGTGRKIITDWSVDPASGTTYSYQIGASTVPIGEGTMFLGATSQVSKPSTALEHRATASLCNMRYLLKRVVIQPVFPSDVTPSSGGVLTEDRLRELFSADSATSLRGYFLAVSNGAWAPEFLHLTARPLPKKKSAYANTTLRAQAGADFAAVRAAAIAANPQLALDQKGTQFVMVVMGEGVLGGEKGGSVIRVANANLQPGSPLAISLPVLVHELGHVVFRHASAMTCTSSKGAKFGYHPTLGIRDGSCVRSGSDYADRSDPMGVKLRHYSGFSKHIAGFLGNLTTLRARSGGNEIHKYRVYSSSVTGPHTNNPVPGELDRKSTQLIKFINDRSLRRYQYALAVTRGLWWRVAGCCPA